MAETAADRTIGVPPMSSVTLFAILGRGAGPASSAAVCDAAGASTAVSGGGAAALEMPPRRCGGCGAACALAASGATLCKARIRSTTAGPGGLVCVSDTQRVSKPALVKSTCCRVEDSVPGRPAAPRPRLCATIARRVLGSDAEAVYEHTPRRMLTLTLGRHARDKEVACCDEVLEFVHADDSFVPQPGFTLANCKA